MILMVRLGELDLLNVKQIFDAAQAVPGEFETVFLLRR